MQRGAVLAHCACASVRSHTHNVNVVRSTMRLRTYTCTHTYERDLAKVVDSFGWAIWYIQLTISNIFAVQVMPENCVPRVQELNSFTQIEQYKNIPAYYHAYKHYSRKSHNECTNFFLFDQKNTFFFLVKPRVFLY